MRPSPLFLLPILLLPVLAHAGFEPQPVEVEPVGEAPATDYAPPLNYPRVAAKLGRQADCRLRVSLDKRGRTEAVESLECDSLFAKRAEVGLSQWTWEPWRVDGKKRAHSFEVVVRFRVEEIEDEAEKDEAEKDEGGTKEADDGKEDPRPE